MSFLLLIFLHHLADVAFQPTWLIENKHHHIFAIYEHTAVYTGVVCSGLYFLGIFAMWKLVFILVGHFLMDWYKYRQEGYGWIYPDQIFHYWQIWMVWL